MRLLLIGIGTGNPDHVTGQAIRTMRKADLILIPRKGAGKTDLADLRRQICKVHLGKNAPIAEFDMPNRDSNRPYLEAVDAWHDAIAQIWLETIESHTPRPRSVALLVWGDPSLYDSTLRIAARLERFPQIEVVPGITALQALTAAHAIPLNDVGAPVLITTGRRLRENGWPLGVERVAVMLDGECSFDCIDPADVHIWWGAYLGMDEQCLEQGPLTRTAERIHEARKAARARHGWIMDTYLLSRRTAPKTH